MTNDPHNASENSQDDIADPTPSSDYQPGYSEPNYETSSAEEIDWEVPTSSGQIDDEVDSHASAPDPTPLLDDQHLSSDPSGDVSSDDAAPAQWWETGRDVGSTGPSLPDFGQQPPPGDSGQDQQGYQAQGQQGPYPGQAQQGPYPGQAQQGPYPGQAPGQPYQPGAPMGGMPPQSYTGGYAPMPAGQYNPNWLAGPTEQGRSTLTLDYWLSVFFSWIPALIFFLTEREKNQLVDEHTKELLNFNITRVIVGAVTAIPIVGWIVGGIGSIVLFVMAILGAMKGTEEYASGRVYRFPLTFRFIK